jgi:hypothetical protein
VRAALAHQVVRGQAHGRGEGREHPETVERAAVLPHLGDEDQAGQRQAQGRPEPAAYPLAPHQPDVEGDQHGGGHLEHQRDPDRHAADGHVVEPLGEGDADDAEHRQERQFAGGDPEPPG